MDILTLMLIAVALGTDAFALAVGIGVTGVRNSKVIVVSLVVCIFHIFMPLIGLGVGTVLGNIVGDVATLIGAIVLIAIGLNILWEVFKNRVHVMPFPQAKKELKLDTRETRSINTVWGMMLLAGGVSIDALSVGFGLGALKAQIALTVIVLGIVAGLMTAGGFLLGRRLGDWLGEKAEVAGGLILVAVGIKLMF